MKKKALWKSIIREIFESKARFLSILGIILLGVCFYAGIKATGPDMINTADHYFGDKKLMDSKLLSTMGFTDKDLELLEKEPEIAEIMPTYSKDVNILADNRVVRFYAYDLKDNKQLNNYRVMSGRLPEKKNEIALDNLALLYNEYKIGDTFKIDADQETLKDFGETSFEVVGFVNSPMLIENMSRGNTPVGKGAVDYFAVLPVEQFKLEVYTEVYLRYHDTKKTTAYSKEYEQRVNKHTRELKKTFKKRPAERIAEIKEEAAGDLNKAKKDIAAGEVKLTDAKKELDDGKTKLVTGQQELAEAEATYYQKIQDGEAELAASSQQLTNGQNQLATQEEALVQAKQTLEASAAELATGEQQLKNQGIDPNTNVAVIQGQITTVQQFADGLSGVANDITETLTSVADGEPIPDATLSGWSASLDNPFVDLSAAQAGIMGMSGVPLTPEIRPLILGIPPQLNAASAEASQKIPALEQLLNALVPFQEGRRKYQAGLAEYQSGLAQIEGARIELANGQVSLDQGYAELAQAKIDGQNQLANGRSDLENAASDIEAGEKKITAEEKKLTDGKKELTDQEKKLAELKEPEYLFFDRDDNPGYTEYHENSKRISSIATVFPVFFFMIAALVSLTTMTRMVDEKRGEIGTLKALGYTNWEIAQKYIVYATAASLIGSLLGLIIGFNVFPKVIINAYGALYNLPEAIITYYPSYSLQSLIVALMCTLISAMIVLYYDLFSSPASLMRPKAPKAGQRIFLERLTFIWKRLNFNQKVTARNLFRYKQRMFMTVFGIAGCMALIITGFGLRDSISDVVDIQFSKLWHYQGIVTYNEEATAEENKKYETAVAKTANLSERLVLSQESMQVIEKGKTTQTITLDVPKDSKNLADFVLFNDRKSKEVYTISDQGAIINEKLAKMFHLKVGDTFELTDNDNQKYPVKVDQVVENYAMHFVYMTPAYYESVFKQEPTYNSELLLFKKAPSKKVEDQIAESLMENEKVVNVSFLSQTSSAMDDTIDSLTIVVWVLIISAATLAFIVLYNLTNINISERIRELSTIKVLGFYDNEVTMYVYRENNILTGLGILVGCVIGKLLHGFVLETAEVDMLMFSPTIHIASYVYSGLLTAFFSFVVMLVMHRKLRKVDMIEALKSTE